MCGAYAQKGEAEIIAEYYPAFWQRVMVLEEKMRGGRKPCRWGWHDVDRETRCLFGCGT
jgi:hypothetical protein